MIKANPFVITFGKKPSCYISRPQEFQEIITSFEQNPASVQSYLISGVRGCGKTALMNVVTSYFEDKDDWVVVKINPERDIITSLASKLYDKGSSKHLFSKMSLSLSLYGISLSISGSNPINDPESILDRLFADAKKHGKKVLIAIDEVSNSKYVRVFAHTFQALVGDDMPAFLLMTGLYENIHSLQNEKTMTFLYRAPVIELKPLDLIDIAVSYEGIFNIGKSEAGTLAKMTGGYAFAYQALGYILFNSKETKISDEILESYDSYLRKFAYDKMWDSCTKIERNILGCIQSEGTSTGDCIAKSALDKGTFSVYRKRLLQKGLIDTSTYGMIRFPLPRFFEYVTNKKDYEL